MNKEPLNEIRQLPEEKEVTIDAYWDFDGYLYLIHPDGDTDYDDDHGSTSRSRINIEIPETGVYTILATSYYDDSTGGYELTLE